MRVRATRSERGARPGSLRQWADDRNSSRGWPARRPLFCGPRRLGDGDATQHADVASCETLLTRTSLAHLTPL